MTQSYTSHLFRFAFIVLFVVMTTGLTGCASYLHPLHRLDPPDTLGPLKRAALDLTLGSGNELLATPQTNSDGDEILPVTFPQTELVFRFRVGASTDLVLRAGAYVPPTIGAQFQLFGPSRSDETDGDWVGSFTVSGGALLGKYGGEKLTYLLFRTSLPMGYRLRSRHWFVFTPHAAFGSIKGSELPVQGTNTSYGVAAGYQLKLESIILKLEEGYVRGKFGSSELGEFATSASFGIEID